MGLWAFFCGWVVPTLPQPGLQENLLLCAKPPQRPMQHHLPGYDPWRQMRGSVALGTLSTPHRVERAHRGHGSKMRDNGVGWLSHPTGQRYQGLHSQGLQQRSPQVRDQTVRYSRTTARDVPTALMAQRNLMSHVSRERKGLPFGRCGIGVLGRARG
ncbi:hypothetical protein F5Y16DRAFT_261758 [Xylariaceae sp. FL0255]|nr:hypothetical protein F5Y16DRAFT_261758 [Xylariaceae sp. FL0255]